jgi:hypothetical protein
MSLNKQPSTIVKVTTARVLPEMEKTSGLFFTYKKVVLLLSNDEQTAHGDKLAAQIDLLNVCHPKEIAIINTAYLQRYNMILNDEKLLNEYCTSSEVKVPNDIEQKALQAEENWLEENTVYIKQIKNQNPIKIINWSELIKNKSTANARKEVEDWLKSDKKAQIAFEKTATVFLNVHHKNYIAKDQGRHLRCSMDYLKEEATVFYLVMANENWDYIFYPREIPDALKSAFKKFIEEKNKSGLQWMHIHLQDKEYDTMNPTGFLRDYEGYSYRIQRVVNAVKHYYSMPVQPTCCETKPVVPHTTFFSPVSTNNGNDKSLITSSSPTPEAAPDIPDINELKIMIGNAMCAFTILQTYLSVRATNPHKEPKIPITPSEIQTLSLHISSTCKTIRTILSSAQDSTQIPNQLTNL